MLVMEVNIVNEKMIENLSNKVWITRKCRINSSERLIVTNLLSQILINYFTLVILSISIWTLFSSNESDYFSFITIIASLFLFAGTIGVNSLNYKERISNLKSCYIELDELLGDLEILKNDILTLEKENARTRFDNIRTSYKKILDDVENHNSYDYLKFQVNTKEYRHWTHFVKYYLFNIGFILVILSLVLIPLIPFIGVVTK
ncbi:SLATT domain-containing protein [Metabacillus indicus]|uniref:SLATT domain-containing protein n=1 Tax=Metabacillus indicus TaxID=246786 RepID=UPI00398446A0